MRKIDIHAHTTNRPTRSTGQKYATLDILSEKMKEFDVEKTVVLATYFPHRSSGISNYRLLNWVSEKPEFSMFGSLDFEHYFYQGFNELSELAEAGKIKGIKIYTTYQNIDLNGDKLKSVVKLASSNKLPVMFHCGYSFSSMSSTGKPAITDMVKASDLEHLIAEFRDTNFIISHLNKPFTRDLTNVVKRYANVYSDMSGLIHSNHEDEKEIENSVQEIKIFLAECGSSKLLFGTDFPVQTHADSVYFIERAMGCFPIEAKEDVYYNNARRLLRWN
jgi:predicted TIM-barrel fold metal-dependent hydrolase